MAEIFEMPQASPTMEMGTILAWHKAEGAVLAPQDVIAEVETDKAAMEIEVFDTGVLLKILVAAGDEVPAGAPIAIIGRSADEDISALLAQARATLAAIPAAQAPREAPREAARKTATAPAPVDPAPAAAQPTAPPLLG
ncbi:MAG: hypothetical protein GXP62_12635, partial [Oligoflexia bacterium]|nr:hypothetical protein [Oligoflexia bacterium]